MGKMTQKKRVKRGDKSGRSDMLRSVAAKNAPFPYVEAFKTLRTNLDFISSASGAKCILITSALAGEAKSNTAINLATTLAGSNRSVIVVECDLRKPSIRKYLKLERGKKGLSALLSDNATLDECIVKAEGLGISVIQAGTTPPNPPELLNQKRMAALIEVLKKRYDYVILDAPPAMVVTDAAVVGRVADGALLVVRSKYTPANTVRMAKQRLEAVDIKVLGAVLTCFNAKKSGWRSGYDYAEYEYGYGKYESGK